MNPNKYKRDYRYRSDVNDNDSRRNKIMIAIGFAIVIALYLIFN